MRRDEQENAYSNRRRRMRACVLEGGWVRRPVGGESGRIGALHGVPGIE